MFLEEVDSLENEIVELEKQMDAFMKFMKDTQESKTAMIGAGKLELMIRIACHCIEDLNMTPQNVAAILEIPKKHVFDLLSGRKPPSEKSGASFFMYYRVSLLYLTQKRRFGYLDDSLYLFWFRRANLVQVHQTQSVVEKKCVCGEDMKKGRIYKGRQRCFRKQERLLFGV